MSLIKRTDINVALLGTVSAGKSTFNNAIFTRQYSDMKIKRTTMVPQVYRGTKTETTLEEIQSIKENNRKVNEELIKKTEKNLPITTEDIKEIYYNVPLIPDFVELKDDVNFTFYDIPGLNDSQNNESYFKYIGNNFHKFDIILFIIDVHSAINTSDEMNIARFIMEHIGENSKIGIDTKLIVLVNKCDDMTVDEDDELVLNEEHQEMFDQVKSIMNQIAKDIHPKCDFYIHPLASEDAYIYRALKQDPSTKLDPKHFNKFGYNEFGKSRWTRMSQRLKEKEIAKIIKNAGNYDSALRTSGFTEFMCTMSHFLDIDGQYNFISNRIIHEMTMLDENNKLKVKNLEEKKLFMFDDMDHMMKLLEYKNLIGSTEAMFNRSSRLSESFEKHMLEYSNRYIKHSKCSVDNYIMKTIRPRDEYELRNYITIKRCLKFMNAHFCLGGSELETVDNLIAKYYIDKLNENVSIKDKFEYVDRLIGHGYDKWMRALKSMLICSKYDEQFVKSLNECPSRELYNIRHHFGLDDNDSLEIAFIIMMNQTQEMKNILCSGTNFSAATEKNKILFTRRCFWDAVIIRTTNRYYKLFQNMNALLECRSVKITISNIHNCGYSDPPTSNILELDEYTLNLMKKVYPTDVMHKDELMDMFFSGK